MEQIQWSFSSLKDFMGCPKRYQEHNMQVAGGELSEEEEQQPLTCPMCNVPVLIEDREREARAS